jgi:UDP-GlcNAc:undecaprenyl-phosphate GlcNAc-1-phosphate transferase
LPPVSFGLREPICREAKVAARQTADRAHVTNRTILYLAWFTGSAGLTASITPFVRKLALRLDLVDRPGGQTYKWHQRPTAYLGGAAIACAVVVMVILALAGHTPIDRITVILLGGLVCGAVGFWDDWKTLGVWPKLAATIVGGAAVWAAGVRVALTGIPSADFVLTLAWIVVVTHAVNVIDNMDGVAVGLAALTAVAAFIIAVLSGQTRVALMAAAVTGACVGFLPFNFKPATVFLGDAGTLFLGFVLASLALALDIPDGTALVRATVPVLLLGVPIFNTALVIVSRHRGGRPITVGGTDGVAHRLVALGLTRNQAAVAFWAAGAALAGNALIVALVGGASAVATAAVLLVIGTTAIWLFERLGSGPRERTRLRASTKSHALVPASVKGFARETQEAEGLL